MKEKIMKALVDKISFESERNIFKAYVYFRKYYIINLFAYSYRIIAESIQILIQDLENTCEPALTAMTKVG